MNYISYHWLNWKRTAACNKGEVNALTQFLQHELPERGKSWDSVQYIAIDLESTGLNPVSHEIASIGWVCISQGVIKLNSAKHRLVRTQRGVGQSATIHHLTDTQVSEGLRIEQVLTELLADCAGKIPIFHNANLDMGFIHNACLRTFNNAFITPFIDTLQLEKEKLLAQTALIGPGSLRLHACRSRYGLPEAPAHNALEDALATAELFLAWANHRAGDQGFNWDEAI